MLMYVVGGAVRDLFMGRKSSDMDFVVVGTTPEEMLSLGYYQVGADFPVFLDDQGNEYALARTERKSGKGYNGFETVHDSSVTLEDDLRRRDLTINAMAMPLLSSNPNDTIDPFGGLNDLKFKVLRHVSEAFSDDPVRVLRLARFHARFGHDWVVAPETLKLCRKLVESGELDYLTRERVLKELEKALAEPHTELFFTTLDACGAMEVLFPELSSADKMQTLLRNYHPVSSKLKYAMISMYWMTKVDEFETRLNVSTEFRQYAKMFRVLHSLHATSSIDVLYKSDAYRNEKLFRAITEECVESGFNKVNPHLSWLVEAFDVTHKIGFDDLSETQKSTLKGKEIGDAIRDLRHEKWKLTANAKIDKIIKNSAIDP